MKIRPVGADGRMDGRTDGQTDGQAGRQTDRHDEAKSSIYILNRLTPNDPYMGRTAPLTSKHCILYSYSTNIGTEYFKHALYSTYLFSSKYSLFHNANLFGSCIIHILYTGCAKIKKKIRRQRVKKDSITPNAAGCSTSYYWKLQRHLLLGINGQGDVMRAHSRYITTMPHISSPCLLHVAAVCKQVT